MNVKRIRPLDDFSDDDDDAEKDNEIEKPKPKNPEN